ncbi:MAG TPA: ATP-binding protein [Chloroflexota bacterium]|nr:ATP-binding protein [Chloroflexota bacterium]
MNLWQYYIITLVVLVVTAVWLKRQGRERSQFARALYFLMGLQVAGAAAAYLTVFITQGIWLVLALQLVAWAVLLWGLELDWRLSWGLLVITVVVSLFPFFPILDLLTWGFVMAVPFAAIADLRQRTAFPIFAATPMAHTLRPVATDGHITAEMVLTEQPILECLVDGVLICGPSGLIYSVNQAATVILGMMENALVGRPITAILAHFPALDGMEQGMKERRFDIHGRIVEGQMNLIYDQEGTAEGTVVILRDITQAYQTEQARDAFLTTISHELRTPLTAVKGYTELLQAGTGGALNDTQQAFLQTIQRNVSRMVQLINSLLFAASVKGGHMEAKTGQANIPQIVQQIAREMTPVAAKSKQVIRLDLDSRLHWVEADPIHVTMIVEELVSNGIKYGREGGEIRVTAVLESEEFAVISVADQGIGISPEDQSHMFEDFFRPEWREEQVRTAGIGMGLSVVHSLVEAYNGRIWFETVPDQGTTFTFILPVRRSQQEETLFPPVNSHVSS